MTSQPSEVQTILNDALTGASDLKALLVGQCLPSAEDGSLTDRMMAGASAMSAMVKKTTGKCRDGSPSAVPAATSSFDASYEGDEDGEGFSASYDSHSYTTDSKSYSSGESHGDGDTDSATNGLEPVVPAESKPNDAAPAKDKDEKVLVNQTLDTVNTTGTALDTSYFTQGEPTTTTTEERNLHEEEEAEAEAQPFPESPRCKAERDLDETAQLLAHKSYHSQRSSFEDLFDKGPMTQDKPKLPPPQKESPAESEDDMAGVERRREEQRMEDRQRLAYNKAQVQRQRHLSGSNADGVVSASYDSDDDSFAEELLHMVATDLD